MKLRIRSLDSKETLKIQIPTTTNPSPTLQDFKDAFSLHLSSSSTSETLTLSLSITKTLLPNLPTNLSNPFGDLIFFTSKPNIKAPIEVTTSNSSCSIMGFDSDRTEEKVETLTTMGEDMEMGDGLGEKSLFLDFDDKIKTLTVKEDVVMVSVESDGNIETLTTREDDNVDNVEVVDVLGENSAPGRMGPVKVIDCFSDVYDS
ncbi:hypothetical protein GIB67_003239 [Kingdonia uniflora]|uniref:Uncharacterized protein n=1 Tax=Kingdonia uniflora TaxID=39325 RepID=A0A7J7LH39_9MAGN|nr:hypothetical protein GIB67_003239 [Kingdonia uniflora]